MAALGAPRKPQPQDPAGGEGLRGRVGRRRRAREAFGHGQPGRGGRPPARQSALLRRPESPRGRGGSSRRRLLAAGSPDRGGLAPKREGLRPEEERLARELNPQNG